MPVKRGLVAPQNIFIQTIVKKFDNSPDRNFVLGNAQVNSVPIIYSNDGFCELTGYSRAELMQKNCSCDFLCGEETNEVSAQAVKDALRGNEEKKVEIVYYKKDGTKFICSVVIAPVKSERGDVVMYIVNHEDVTWSPDRTDVDYHVLKSGCLPHRKHNAKLLFKSNKLKPTKCRTSYLARHSNNKNNSEGENYEPPNSIPLLNVHPPSPPELSVVEEKEEEDEEGYEQATKEPLRPCSTPVKSSSLGDLVSNLKRFGSDNILNRSYSLLSATAGPRERTEEYHLPVNSYVSSANSRSDSNLWHTDVDRERPGMWTSKQHLELPRGSSLKIANALPLPQNSLAPGKTEKVAQVMSLGADVLPEYKLQAPKIHPWTILHYSPFKAFWDWLVLFLVIYTAIVTPYMASFVLSRDRKLEILNQDAETRRNYGPLTVYSDPLVIVDYIVDVMFIIDIFINFRTTFVDSNDEVVSNPCRIAVHYVKTWFAVDFVAAIPFELLIMIEKTDQATTLIGLLKTARLLRLVRVARKLDQYSEYGMAVLCLLMCSFALLAHWLACIWYAIGNLERKVKPPHRNIGWLDTLAKQTNQPYNDTDVNSGPDLESKYVTALYFTLSSLTSVGFGNVSPNTNAEKIFSISVMLIGSLFYAAIFGNVAAIIARLYSTTARYHSQMKKVREFIRFHQIPNPLRQRIEDYAHHVWSYTNGFDMDQVMKGFPECLQADICLHLNANLLCTMKVFQSASLGCLRAFALRLTTTHLPPGDYIVYQGDEVNHLFFIIRGTVEVVRDDVIMAILGKGDTFGENFAEDPARPSGTAHASVRALTYCDLHSIKKDDLLYILRQYPRFQSAMNNDLEITYHLRHENKDKKPEYVLHDTLRKRTSSHITDIPLSEVIYATKTARHKDCTSVSLLGPHVIGGKSPKLPQEACAASHVADELDKIELHYGGESSRTGRLKESSKTAVCKTCCQTFERVESKIERLSNRLEQLETRLTTDVEELLELLRVLKQEASDRQQVINFSETSPPSHSNNIPNAAHTLV